MAAPTLQTVWQYWADTFGAIRSGDGYHHDVRTVTTDPLALEQLAGPLTPACVVLYDEAASGNTPVSMPGRDEQRMVFRTIWRVDATGLDTAGRVKAYADLRDDVRRAVAADVTCGGVAWDSRITAGEGPEMDQGRIFARWDVTTWADVEDEAS